MKSDDLPDPIARASALLVVLQLAIGQLTPRVLSLLLSRPRVKPILSLLLFTYVYTLSALGRVEDRVPHLHVSVAVLLNLACIAGFIAFVQRLSGDLRPTSVMSVVAERGRAVIGSVYPAPHALASPEQTARTLLPSHPAAVVASTGRAGVVMAFSAQEFVRHAAEAGAVLELVPEVGDPVAPGDPLVRVHGGTRPVDPGILRGCVAIGDERRLDQDPKFAFRILVDIAIKALSPGINDPTTAMLALDQVHYLLRGLGRRQFDDGQARDREGRLRFVYSTPTWSDYVLMAVSSIRHYGGTSLQADRRLRALLNDLIESLPEARWPPLREELRLLESLVRHGFGDAEESRRAQVDDVQGLGGRSQRRSPAPSAPAPGDPATEGDARLDAGS